MRSALVFGSNGYLGKNITSFLIEQGVNVCCFDIHEKSWNMALNYQKIDITEPRCFDGINLCVDYIYFFSGLTGTYNGFEQAERYIITNEFGLCSLLNAMVKQNSIARIIFPSTRLVYRGKKNTPLKETAVKDPKTIYAINKIACELMLNTYRTVFGINYTVYRIGVPFGNLVEGGLSYGTIGMFEDKAKNGESIVLFGDGNLKRTFTHVRDLVEKIFLSASLHKTNGEIYNIGGETASLKDIANLIAFKHKVKIEHKEWPEKALLIESGDTIFDGTKLDSITYFGVNYTLKQL